MVSALVEAQRGRERRTAELGVDGAALLAAVRDQVRPAGCSAGWRTSWTQWRTSPGPPLTPPLPPGQQPPGAPVPPPTGWDAPPPSPQRGSRRGCVGWLVACGTCQVCCAPEYEDPCTGRRRKGVCHGCNCDCGDCCDADCCNCCDGCDCGCDC